MTRVSSEQGWVGEYPGSETRDHTRHLDGFVSARFFRGLHSDRIVEYVQWGSSTDGTAAFDDAHFAEHMSVNSHFSTGEAPSSTNDSPATPRSRHRARSVRASRRTRLNT
jgi:hypothetical protein